LKAKAALAIAVLDVTRRCAAMVDPFLTRYCRGVLFDD
jgi:hypothetical protein